jgi:S1-C subfamily serine protease
MLLSAAFSVLLLAAPNGPTCGPFVSCAWVRAENDGAGTGFVISVEKKWLVTCRHVLADRKSVDVFFPWRRDSDLVTDRDEYLRNRIRLRELGLLATGKVLKASDELDLALLELDSVPAGVKAVTFAPTVPQPGDRLRVVGNRLDLETVFNLTAGPLRARGRLADGYFWRGRKLAKNAEVLIGQLPTEEGDSGGPVLNDRGELVGVASALRRQCPGAAVCISAAEVRTFVGLAGARAEKPSASPISEALLRATVWVRPTATDIHLAGVLIEPDLVLTCGKRLTPGDRAGIAFPVRDGEQWVTEREAHADPLSLQLRGCWGSATVLAHDRDTGLSLLRLGSPVKFMRPVSLSPRLPRPGDPVHSMSHPGGLEFAWVYACGPVRQRGKVAIALGEGVRHVDALICQLPAQAGSPGGPVLNDRGELVGILSSRESAQQVGYAVSAGEIARLLDSVTLDMVALPDVWLAAAAKGLARRGEEHRAAGLFAEAKRDCDSALSLDPGCVAARVCRAKLAGPKGALAELDAAVEKGPFDRGVLLLRAGLAAAAKDWRKARGDLERILDADPADAEARQRLVPVLLELGKDAEAASAVRDTLRADPKRLATVARDLLSQGDALAKKYPDAPSVPADWLAKAMTATKRDEFAAVLKQAAAAKDDTERLARLRAGLAKLSGK